MHHDFHNHNVVEECEKSVKEVEKFLEKEYKVVAGKSLGLSSDGEIEIDFYKINNKRIGGYAVQKYKVKGLEPEDEGGGVDDPIRKATIDFIQNSKNATRPKNDKAKKDQFKIFEPSKLNTGIRK